MSDEELPEIFAGTPEEDKFYEEYRTMKQETRPFSEILKIWFSFPKYSKELFQSELEKFDMLHMFIGVLIFAILSTVLTVVYPIAECTFVAEKADSFFCPHTVFPSEIITELITGIFAFYFGNLIILWLAKVAGGKGDYKKQAHIYFLYNIPISILIGLATYFDLIPVIGTYIALGLTLLLGIFQIICHTRALQVVHEFPRKKALGFVLIPIILYVLFLIIVYLAP
jgi:hypothetical protein